VVVLALVLKSRKKSFEVFCRLLRKARYRQGRLQGYASRLHYFQTGFMITSGRVSSGMSQRKSVAGLEKDRQFYDDTSRLYPALKDAAHLREMSFLKGQSLGDPILSSERRI